MDRRDTNYYDAQAKTINPDNITSSYHNAKILQSLRDNDPTFEFLQITGEGNYLHEFNFTIGEEDDMGWLGYFVGNNSTLQNLDLLSANRLGDFIDGLSQNKSIQSLYIGADFGRGFQQMGDFFRSNNNMRELSFGSMDTIGVESARSIAFMLSQCHQSNLRVLSLEESNASDEVLAEIATAISFHSNLEELNLGVNNLGRDGSVALGKALQACNNPRLQKLLLLINSIDDEGLRALVDGMRNCHNLTELDLADNESITADGFRSLSTLFQSELCHLKHLDLSSMNIENDGAAALAVGLASLSSLETLNISENDIGDDGARALGAGLVNLHSLEKLNLEENAIGDDGARGIAAGLVNLHSLETLDLGNNIIGDVGATAIVNSLQSPKTLYLSGNSIGDYGSIALAAGLAKLHSIEKLYLRDNFIGDLGVQALVDGLVNCVNLEELSFLGNRSITASGLSSFSTLLQSESCSLTDILLGRVPFGDDGAVALADVLKGNTSMKQLYFIPDSARVTSVGWSAFSKLLCDTSSVNATYLSNHRIKTVGNWSNEGTPDDVKALLALSKHPAEHVAIHKILKSHPDFVVEPFFEWKMKLLPLVVSWFERVRNLMIMNVDDHKWISVESVEEIQSRQLSAMYNFVRGMPLVAVDGYRSRNNTAVLAPSRKRKIEELCR